MTRRSAIRVLLAAGGTGGHLFPAEALAGALLARGLRVDLATDARAASFGERPAAIGIHRIKSGGIAGKSLARRLVNAAHLCWGLAQSVALTARLKPDCVVGFGGYVSVPPVLAAQWLGVPTMIHEQNAVMGRANRLLAKRARLIALGFKDARPANAPAKAKYVLTGNPVRPAILALADQVYRPAREDERFALFVMGGSQGARIFATLIPEAIAALPEDKRKRLIVASQCRAEDVERARAAFARMGVEAELKPFFDDVPARLRQAHLTIARAGASTVAELGAAGRPAILVPLKNAIDGHQSANARALEDEGAAWTISEEEAGQRLPGLLARLMDEPETLSRVAAMARASAKRDAADRLAELAISLAEERPARKSLEMLA
jgi:UDP-N-acetylglucosamine--N-acetylmuramyl-(pentapeptide) pyrophosphoryl-undecaprenol N-acetylglucosamine transferase